MILELQAGQAQVASRPFAEHFPALRNSPDRLKTRIHSPGFTSPRILEYTVSLLEIVLFRGIADTRMSPGASTTASVCIGCHSATAHVLARGSGNGTARVSVGASARSIETACARVAASAWVRWILDFEKDSGRFIATKAKGPKSINCKPLPEKMSPSFSQEGKV